MRFTPLQLLAQFLMLVLLIAFLPTLAGCRTTVVTVTRPDGTIIKAENYSLGNDTSIDELTVPTTLGPATLKGANSQSKLTAAAADMAATARKLSGAGAAP